MVETTFLSDPGVFFSGTETNALKRSASAESMVFKGEAQATIENARGNAEKVKLIAAAEAESIRLKGESLKLYPDVIQLEFVVSLSDPDGNVTWGILPQEGVLPFLNVNP